MKIGFDAKRLFNNFTGLGNYSRTLLDNLAAYHPENSYFLFTPKIKSTPETERFLVNDKFKTILPNTFFKLGWRSFGIKKQLLQNKIELYHGLSHELPVNIDKTTIKSIVTIHDLIFKVYPKTYSFPDRKMYDLKFKYSCRHSNKIIAISENTKKDIVNFYQIDPEKIEVIYQSVNPIFYQSDFQEDSKSVLEQFNIPKQYLLYVGTVEPRKNLKSVVEAYGFLSSDFKIPLVVVGRGKKYKLEVEALSRKMGIENKIIWINYLGNNTNLKTIYQNALAFIYPSFYEGFGIPIVEALLSKTAVISAKTSSLTEAGGPDSFYVNPKNAEEIAMGIEKILGDSILRNRMIENGFAYANKMFGSESVTEQMNNLYKKVLTDLL